MLKRIQIRAMLYAAKFAALIAVLGYLINCKENKCSKKNLICKT